MSLTALLLILGCSLGWAGFDVLRKQLAAGAAVVPLTALLTAGQAPIFVVWLLLRWPGELGAAYWVPGSAAMLLNILANLMLIRALALAPLSLTIPLLSLTPVLTAAAALPLLGERPTPLQLVGIVLVVGSALLLGLDPTARGEATEPRSAVTRGRLLMVGVAALWAMTGPVDKLAMRFAPPAFHALVQTGGIGAVLLLATTLRRQRHQLRPLLAQFPRLAAALLLASAGLGLQLLAIQRTLVSLVETIKRAIGLLGAMLSGRIFFAEPLTATKLIAATAMGFGIALVCSA